MDFHQAKAIFEHTLNSDQGVSKKLNDALFGLIDKEVIEATSQLVSGAIFGGERVWMTSDLHFGHQNIISYCDRPFNNVSEQNDSLLQLLRKISENELVVFVGDMAMGNYEAGVEVMRMLPGRKILVVGNHDLTGSGKCRLADEEIFEVVVPFLFWQGLKQTSVLVCHYPVAPYFPFTFNLINYHGHLHQKVMDPVPEGISIKHINVGWDRTHSLLCL
jgi:calcineurin-like phosphoesterase family protein